MKKILAGKVALLTGAAKGIGLETARQLDLLDAAVMVSARDVTKAAATAWPVAITPKPIPLDERSGMQ